jgi:hypothetical protein
MSRAPGLFVDVVIPFRGWDAWTAESAEAALKLDPPCRRVTLVPDAPLGPDAWAAIRKMPGSERVRELPSGPLNPGSKRNRAMDGSEADVFGFVDSDARVWPDWLGKGLPPFADETVGIVGGPNLTPPEDDARRKACGDVMASPLGMGAAYVRHVAVSRREVTELPTCNMLARNLPGFRFRPELDTSEDMAFCGLAREKGLRLVYDPDVGVWHHRRRLGRAFARQFHDYGLYQGRRAAWRWIWRAVPVGLILYLAILAAALAVFPGNWRLWMLPLGLYLAGIAAESARLTKASPRWFLTVAAFPWAHVAYGFGYLRGWLDSRNAVPGEKPG